MSTPVELIGSNADVQDGDTIAVWFSCGAASAVAECSRRM